MKTSKCGFAKQKVSVKTSKCGFAKQKVSVKTSKCGFAKQKVSVKTSTFHLVYSIYEKYHLVSKEALIFINEQNLSISTIFKVL